MQIKLLFRLILAVVPLSSFGQSTFIRTGDVAQAMADRLEIKTRQPVFSQSFTRPYSRKNVFAAIDSIHADTALATMLTKIDRYNIERFTRDPEWKWKAANRTAFNRDVNVPDGNEVKTPWVIQPVANLAYSSESGNARDPFIATLGLDTRGILFNKIAFNLYATSNLERLPHYMDNWLSRYESVPGIGRYNMRPDGKIFYADIRGSVQTSVTRFIDLQLGYDRFFLGNGHRSLFLGDMSNNAAFFRINANIWKLNFQSLYMKLTPQEGIINKADHNKFLRINTLGIDATRWLNISFFDAVVLGRKNGFDLNYVLPITFLRAMEQQSGSPDNALFGMNVKANVAGRVQLYAQGVLDEFKLNELKSGNGWWANKYGYQLGAKYIDAFGINNMDIQVETNRVRPFTYTHFDSVSNYTHSGQPLAHPLGANFHEWTGILNYQPHKKIHINLKTVYYVQGLDSAGYGMGNNILVGYKDRVRDHGWSVGTGDKATCLFIRGSIAYELHRNLFLDVSALVRNFNTASGIQNNTRMFSAGLRWNINRREFDY